MAKKKTAVSWDTVREIGLALPNVKESPYWGTIALKVNDRPFAIIPNHKSSEPDSVVLYLRDEDRDALLEEDPETYYLPDHYEPHSCVLIRLTRIRRDALADLVRGSWTFVRQKPGRAGRAGKMNAR